MEESFKFEYKMKKNESDIFLRLAFILRWKPIFPRPPCKRKCKVILSNVQRAFHLHFMLSGAI